MGVEGPGAGTGEGGPAGTERHTHPQLTCSGPRGRGAALSRCSRCSLHSVSRERRPLGGT